MKTSSQTYWQERKFGELFRIKHGYAFKGEYFSDSGLYIVLTPGNFHEEGGFKSKENKEKYYTDEVPPGFILSKGDLIIAMTEQAEGLLGSSALVPQNNLYLHNQRLGFITRLDEAKVDKTFLYYLFNSRDVRNQIRASANGTKIRHTSPDRMYQVRVKLPEVRTQRKIVSILSAYDRLIENNNRRIKILEEMAQTLYREWFVNFRFPGCEQTELIDSELGLIPEGWEVVNLRDVSSYINRGISPKYDDQSTSIAINQKCIRDCQINLDLVRRHSKKVSPEKFVQFGDVLVNSTGRGTLGRVAQVYQDITDCTVDSHVSIVRSLKIVNVDYFGFSLFRLQSYFDHSGVGSTGQTELSRESIANAKFLLPPIDIQQVFGQAVSPMRHSIIKLFAKNANLRKTRDLLLPKLISGEIDVENLDIETEVTAA